MASELAEVLAALATGRLADRVRLDAPLGALTTYRVGGAARALIVLEDDDDVDALVDALGGGRVAVAVIGRGSNLLVSDEGFEGIAVTLGPGFSDVQVDGCSVIAGAAAKLPVVARASVAAGLSGFEWAVGVPGAIGGAVRMNAGGHGSDMKDSVAAATVADLRTGTVEQRSAPQLAFGYRQSSIGPDDLVLRVHLLLEEAEHLVGAAEMTSIVQWRRDNQPGGQNAGSVFTNPPGDSAGRLIEAAGLKGHRIGTARVSDKHANFIQADPGGLAADIRALMDAIRERVRTAYGIDLEVETQMLGFDR